MHSTTRHIPQYGILVMLVHRFMVTLTQPQKGRSNAPFSVPEKLYTPPTTTLCYMCYYNRVSPTATFIY